MRLSNFARTVYRQERSLAPSSWHQLETSIRLFEEQFPDVELDDLSHQLLNDWIQANPRDWSPKTIRRRVSDVLAIWSYAYEVGDTDNQPMRKRVRRIRQEKRIPDAWTLKDAQAILTAASTFKDYLPNGVQRGQLLRSVFLVGFYSALRPQDLKVLRRSQLGGDDPAAVFQQKVSAEVLVRIPAWVVRDIDAKYPPEVELVLAWPFSTKYFYDVWKDMLRRAGLRATKRDCLQKLRRTAVSHGEAARHGYGALLAGHTPGSRTTYESYADPRIVNPPQNLLPDLRSALAGMISFRDTGHTIRRDTG